MQVLCPISHASLPVKRVQPWIIWGPQTNQWRSNSFRSTYLEMGAGHSIPAGAVTINQAVVPRSLLESIAATLLAPRVAIYRGNVYEDGGPFRMWVPLIKRIAGKEMRRIIGPTEITEQNTPSVIDQPETVGTRFRNNQPSSSPTPGSLYRHPSKTAISAPFSGASFAGETDRVPGNTFAFDANRTAQRIARVFIRPGNLTGRRICHRARTPDPLAPYLTPATVSDASARSYRAEPLTHSGRDPGRLWGGRWTAASQAKATTAQADGECQQRPCRPQRKMRRVYGTEHCIRPGFQRLSTAW